MMEKETHEKKGIVGNSGQVNQGRSENLSGNSSNLNNGVMLNSGDMVSDRGECEVLDVNINELRSSMRVLNPEATDGRAVDESLNEGPGRNSSETVILINSGELASIYQGKKDFGEKTDDLGLSGGVTSQQMCGGRANREGLEQVEERRNGDSINLADGAVLETVIMINSEENEDIGGGTMGLEVKGNESELSKVMVDKSKTKVPKGDRATCVIDVKCGGGGGRGGGGGGFKDSWEGERICRICHLSSDGLLETTARTTPATTTSLDLIQLGCGCKDELGIAHAHCAEAWFKLKGNRICEICGETAKNITGVGDNRFMEEWNQRRFIGSSSSSSDRGGGCWRGQPFCNFLMACLVIAFVLPWFFRVNMF